MPQLSRLIFSIAIIVLSNIAIGKEINTQQFLSKAFSNVKPEMKTLWLNNDMKEQLAGILNHQYTGLRIRYWINDGRTAWILDEIGKERPITIGIVIDDNQIELVRVLEFRESRGGEVRYPFFTEQFQGAGLNSNDKLTKHIDGISGATLSVRAVTKVSRVALHLHQQVRN